MRDACHQVDVADLDAGRAGHAIGDEVRPFGRARHAQPRIGQFHAATPVIIGEDRARFGMDDHRHAKRLRHRVHRDVVMRRADAAGGEEIIVAVPQRIHRHDNRVDVVRHHAHFGQADALDL